MKHTKIEWTDHTFNPWWGCAMVSLACRLCYAMMMAQRFPGATWGPNGQRRLFGPEHWAEPLAWNRAAGRMGVRAKVFCASMADVFELRPDLDGERQKLWELIDRTPNLDWLLLTKRPELVKTLAPWGNDWPANVWLGTTIENQEWAEKRLPYLFDVPAKVRFVSAEPLLGPIDLTTCIPAAGPSPLHWIIAGGETGHGASPSHPDWFRGLRDYSTDRGIAFFFKQWGVWGPDLSLDPNPAAKEVFPEILMSPAGKLLTGRVLDGTVHDGFPVPPAATQSLFF
jgi:protein gp37